MTALPLLLALVAADPPKEPDYEALLNDKMAAGVTPGTNANVLLWTAFGPRPEGTDVPDEFFARLGLPRPPADGDYFVGGTAFTRDRLKLDPADTTAFYDQQGRAAKRPWAAKDAPRVAEWLAANDKPLAVVVEAAGRPGYYNPLVSRRGPDGKPTGMIGALLPSVQKCREAAQALTCRAMLRLGEGKPDAAWADILACHRLGRLVGRGGTLIEALVGYAVGAVAANATLPYLDHPGLTAEVLRGRLKELQALPPFPAAADNVDRGERLFYLDSVQFLSKGQLDLTPGEAKKPNPEDAKKLAALDWDLVARDGTKWFDRMVAALREPTRAGRVKALGAIEADLKALQGKRPVKDDELHRLLRQGGGKAVSQQVSNTLLGLLMPAVGKVSDAHDRVTQIERNLQVAAALAAYRAEHGKYPAKLADLAPGVLKTVPDDLFSGKPLVYKPADKGYVLYSVGVNGRDEEGRSFDDNPQGDDLPVWMPAAK
ncbi:MAG: hypothetical protein K2X82_33810 [Gemmataceae bacterium]|nr:hypothetical protein [Gemmataceae bacterium]